MIPAQRVCCIRTLIADTLRPANAERVASAADLKSIKVDAEIGAGSGKSVYGGHQRQPFPAKLDNRGPAPSDKCAIFSKRRKTL